MSTMLAARNLGILIVGVDRLKRAALRWMRMFRIRKRLPVKQSFPYAFSLTIAELDLKIRHKHRFV